MTTTTDPDTSTPPESAPKPRSLRRRAMSRVSIQSKLILMLVVSTVLAAAVVGAIAFEVGRTSLRTAVFNRLTEIRSPNRGTGGRVRRPEELADHLHPRRDHHRCARRPSPPGSTSSPTPRSVRRSGRASSTTTTHLHQADQQQSGTQLDAAALLPTTPTRSATCRPTTPRACRPTTTRPIAIDDARDGSHGRRPTPGIRTSSGRSCTRFEFEDALLLDARGNVVYSAYKGVDLGTNIVTGPYAGSKLHEAYLKAMSSNAVDYVGLTDFEFYQPAEMQPTAWMVAPIGSGTADRRRSGAAVPDLQDQPADDRSTRSGRTPAWAAPGRPSWSGPTA